MEAKQKDQPLIYVVDDDEDNLAVLRILLTDAGYTVVTTADADRVVSAVKELKPALVILDVMLPSDQGLDGFQLCTEIRSDKTLADTKVIILSSIASGSHAEVAKLRMQIRADDYITKPYEPTKLLARVRELVG